jgi:peptide/nickel transport system substrate-binding protein
MKEETMFSNKKLAIVVVLLMIAPMVLAACGATPEKVVETVIVPGEAKTIIETVVVEQTKIVTEAGEEKTIIETVVVEVPKEVIVEVTPEPGPVAERTGAWLDTVIFTEEPDSDAAVTRLEVGDIDVFAYNVSEPDIAARIFDSASLVYETAYGNYNEITFNPSGPEFNDGRLNPFSVPKIREAMNWLTDRDYIAQEICGGLSVPRFVAVNYASKDSALLADKIAAIALKYGYDPDRGKMVIDEEMAALGAEMVDGKWFYNGEPVVIIALIRTEDERLEIGDYMSNLLEDVGFTLQRDYRTSAEASPCWMRGDPTEGCFHFYTGGWVSTAISRDAGTNFGYFYTPLGLPFPLWQAYVNTPEFYEVADKLYNNDFKSMEERADLFAQALELSLEDSVRIWLKDDVGVAPHAANIMLASDLSGSIYGSWLWAQTMRFTDKVGGTMNIAMPSIMTEPWNAVAGTNWVYDMMPIRSIQDHAVVPDPFTGLTIPNRLTKAEVTAVEGLPIDLTLDWTTLEFVPEIVVPDDAWADWDAVNQVFMTPSERFTQTDVVTALSKVVMYYEEDVFDKITWHDGSPLDLGDMVMRWINYFDRPKPDSPYYDAAEVPDFQSFMGSFKAFKIVSEDPLVIEYYTDAYGLDAEDNVTNFRAAYPVYSQGQAAWHNLVPGMRADAAGEAAFSADKADANTVEWISYIAGPTLEIMKAQLDAAQAENWIPYEPTLGNYITAEEATARYANLQEFYRRWGHFYIGTGPFYLQKAFPVEGTLILQRYEAYPDLATKWDRFATAPIPEVLVEGPESVGIGSEAVFDIYVDLLGEPYPSGDLSITKFLVFDATGELAYVGEAELVEEGYYTATIGADVTGALPAGSNQLAAIIVSSRALVPVRDSVQFVTQ